MKIKPPHLFISPRASGIRGIEAHMEVDHPAVAEEDWAYTVATLATKVPQASRTFVSCF